MESYFKECTEEAIEKSIENGYKRGLFGTLTGNMLEAFNKISIQIKPPNYFSSEYVNGSYNHITNVVSINSNCWIPFLYPSVLHEVLHSIQASFYERQYSNREILNRETYERKLDNFLHDRLGSDFYALKNVNCLYSWAYSRREINADAEVMCSKGFIFTHPDLFWKMTLRADVILGWDLGETMQYGADIAVEDILNGEKIGGEFSMENSPPIC